MTNTNPTQSSNKSSSLMAAWTGCASVADFAERARGLGIARAEVAAFLRSMSMPRAAGMVR